MKHYLKTSEIDSKISAFKEEIFSTFNCEQLIEHEITNEISEYENRIYELKEFIYLIEQKIGKKVVAKQKIYKGIDNDECILIQIIYEKDSIVSV
jgi:hypothetical protein